MRLSIVIPCPGSGKQFEDTLVSVLQNRPDDCEVLVVYAGSYDDPYDLRDEVGIVETAADTTLLELINLGMEAATGGVIHLLMCGVEVDEGWTTAAVHWFDHADVGAVAPLLSSSGGIPFTAMAGVTYGASGRRCLRRARTTARFRRARLPKVLGPTLKAGFYRRDALRSIGGWDAAVGEDFADVDLALALRAAGFRTVCEPTSHIFESAPPVRETGGYENGRCAEILFWKHAAAFGWLRSLPAHALLVASELIRAVARPRYLGQLWGRMTTCLMMPFSGRTQNSPTTAAHMSSQEDPQRYSEIDTSLRRNVA